jgi:hypothetical protein
MKAEPVLIPVSSVSSFFEEETKTLVESIAILRKMNYNIG